MDVLVAVVADEQPLEVVQPGEGALDDPAVAAEPGTVLCLAAGDHGLDPSLPNLAAVLVVVIAAVGDQTVGTATRPADAATHGRHGVEQRDQLSDVVAVAAGQAPGEWEAAAVDEEVMLGARPAAIDRAWTGLAAPFFACT